MVRPATMTPLPCPKNLENAPIVLAARSTSFKYILLISKLFSSQPTQISSQSTSLQLGSLISTGGKAPFQDRDKNQRNYQKAA
jgi:hypothetical protein